MAWLTTLDSGNLRIVSIESVKQTLVLGWVYPPPSYSNRIVTTTYEYHGIATSSATTLMDDIKTANPTAFDISFAAGPAGGGTISYTMKSETGWALDT